MVAGEFFDVIVQIMFPRGVDLYPVKGIVGSGVVVAEFFRTPPALAGLFFQPAENRLPTGNAERQISGHTLPELFSLVSYKAMDVAEPHPQQTVENIFGYGDEFFCIHMHRTVVFHP